MEYQELWFCIIRVFLEFLGISQGFPVVLRGVSGIPVSPQGYQEFKICIIRVSLRFLGVLWCIRSYKSVLLGYLWGSLGYNWGTKGKGWPLHSNETPLGINSYSFLLLGYPWGSLGFPWGSLGFLGVKRRAGSGMADVPVRHLNMFGLRKKSDCHFNIKLNKNDREFSVCVTLWINKIKDNKWSVQGGINVPHLC